MNLETRLAEVVAALEAVGLRCLVMGGHAVRFYGLDRGTNDVDLHLAPDCWADLSLKLRQTPLFGEIPPVEGPSWRPKDFRRFQIGTLPSGREEWLEFWRENHLLAPFEVLFVRREVGLYGGRALAFLSLPDLIRSKETEREVDWQDLAYLEEFQDARLFARADAGEVSWEAALAQVRSRRGFESFLQSGRLVDPLIVEQALLKTGLSISQAYLIPCAPGIRELPDVSVPIEPVVLERLRSAHPGSNLHLALVEVVRRQYKLAAQTADKTNKEAIRAAQAAQGEETVPGDP